MNEKTDAVQRMRDYIRRLRLFKSALRLRDERIKVIDIAFEMDFASVYGYQRAFQREFGCNPKEYAKNPVPLSLFTPFGVKFRGNRRKEHLEIKNVFIQVMEKPARKVIIKRGTKSTDYWSCCQEVECDVWGLLTSIKSLVVESVCLWLPKQFIKPDTSEYVQGVEVNIDYDGIIPQGFDSIELPAAIGYKWDEEIPRIQLEPIGSRVILN